MSASLFGETEARYAALAGVVHGARVLDLREHTDARCIDALVTAGATSITVCAPETVRRELTTQNVELQLVPPLTLPLNFAPESFDVVICFDLLARAEADPTWTSSVRGVLAGSGAVVVATSSADAATSVLGPVFGVATVFAQSPLVGHMLYDIAAEELEPELDRIWADDANDEPMAYMVVFAPDERHNEKLTLVQMPFSAWQRVSGAETESLRVERDTLQQELAVLRDELARQASQQDSGASDRATLEAELTSARNEIAVLVGELENLRSQLDQQYAQYAGGAELSEELTRHRSDRASLEAQIADLLEESATMSARRVEWQARLDGAEQELAGERARVAELVSQGLAAAARCDELEERLRREEERSSTVDQESAAERMRAAELASAHAEAAGRIAELEDVAARDRGLREEQQRRTDELQRTLDASRRRGDDLARALDADRQVIAELKDGLEGERRRGEELRQALERAEAAATQASSQVAPLGPETSSDDAERQTSEALLHAQQETQEAQAALAAARQEVTQASEALRTEQVRNEQLLARLLELEGQLGGPPKEMENPSGGKAADGKS